MTTQEKTKLVRQAGKLYTLGLKVERRREKLRQLVGKGVPYESGQMKKALEAFQAADKEWRQLEQEHVQFRAQLGIESNEGI